MKKRSLKVRNRNAAMPLKADDNMGNKIVGNFDETDLGTNLPNSFISNRGDINQMSRSEEAEKENNTDLSRDTNSTVDKLIH